MQRDPGPERALTAGRAVRLAEGTLGLAVTALLMGMMLIATVDVFGRYLLSQPVPGAFELIEIMLALTIFMALPLVCLKEENIAATLLVERFSAPARRIHGGVVSGLCALVLLIVAWRLYAHAAQLASYGDVTIFLRLPKGPLGYVMAFLATLGAAALALVAVDTLAGARRPGDPSAAAGSVPSADPPR